MRTESQGSGYLYVVIEGHPMADSRGRVLLHRYVMSNHIGRNLFDSEIVHHINRDLADNRIENLKIMSMGEHTKLHHPKKIVNLECPMCGKKFQRALRQINGSLCFCGRGCSSKYYGHLIPRGVGCFKPITHGQTGYNRGCRCEVCTEAKRVAVAKWRMKRKNKDR
jgi:hypothetical protein